MRMVIVALSLFTVAAVTAMQANAADKPDSVEGVGVEGVEEKSVAVEENKSDVTPLGQAAQAAQAARRFTIKIGRKTAIFAIFATAALVAGRYVNLGPLPGPLVELARQGLLWRDDDPAFVYDKYQDRDLYCPLSEEEDRLLAAHARTAGSVWIPAGLLSSLAIFSIATMLFIFWTLKNPRKAGQKGRFISIPK